MFGMGFTEILLIALVAIIALGPEKLPTAMVQIAKFINKFKSGIEDAKSTLHSELNVSEMKEEANKFKSQIEETKSSFAIDSKLDLGLKDITNDDLNIASSIDNKINKMEEVKQEKISFKKEDKFKINLNEKKEDNA
jgi:sec-independent protein translocase protein TatB